MFGNPFKKYRQQYRELYSRLYDLQEQLNTEQNDSPCAKQLEAEIESINKRIAVFVEDEYALAVFEYYAKKNPKLVGAYTGEKFTWDTAFGNHFEDVPRALRYSLVCLIEGGGEYKLK